MALAALSAVGASTNDTDKASADYDFLVKYMPEKDRGKVSEEYLRTNVKLAREALEAAPWRDMVSDELFREYVLPYSSIGEDADEWRALFREKFWPLVKDCKTTGEAVGLINLKLGDILGVRYSTKRDKPDQSPFHSMRIGIASCTGLAILQIDACRACGIPVRFVGCNWTTIRGNHSWVEYYDDGAWHFYGDPVDGKPSKPDESWIIPYAAAADASSPRTRIYATRWSRSGTWFWQTWTGRDAPSDVPADDVTASYTRFLPDVPKSRVAFVSRDANGRRVPTAFRLVASGSGKVLAEGVTYDDTHDANDHFTVSLPEHTLALVQVKLGKRLFKSVGQVEFGNEIKLVEL